jgi:gliding motility-associated-like protein
MGVEVSAQQCPGTIPELSKYGAGAYNFRKVGDGCLPYTLSVKNTMIGVSNVRTIFDYQGGPLTPEKFSRDTLHTYTKPKVYNLIQLSEANGRELIACIRVYVYDTLQPNVSLISCGASQAKITFDPVQDVNYDTYWIDWGDGRQDTLNYRPESISHRYATTAAFPIRVWGVNRPGYCRSQVATLNYNPTAPPRQPAVEAYTERSPTQAELVVSNPMGVKIRLQKQSGTSWVDLPQSWSGQRQTIQAQLDSLADNCFRVQAIDSCLTETYVSEPACPASLQLDRQPTATTLVWETTDTTPNARLIIRKDGTDWQEIANPGGQGTLTDTELSCNQNHCYTLVVASPAYTFTSLPLCRPTPVELCAANPVLFIPDAFSPNGDGINDIFLPKGEVETSQSMTIYDTWGAVVFQTDTPQNGWDGTYNGTPLPVGPYPYRIMIRNASTGKEFIRRGIIQLIK